MADRGGRLAVRGVPVLVRDAVQRLLPAAAADPRRADPARGGVRVPRQGRRPRLAASGGTSPSSSARRCRRCCGGSRSPTSSAVCRSTPTATSPATSSPCSTRTACSAGWRRGPLRAPTERSSWRSRPPVTSGTRPARWPAKIGIAAVVLGAAFLVWTLLAHGDLGSLGALLLTAVALVAGLYANARGPRGLGLRPGRRPTCRAGRDAVRGAVPERHAVDDEPGLHPHDRERQLHAVHPRRHVVDRRCSRLPFVLVYQGWTYWVFRKRIGRGHIPTTPQHGARLLVP